MSTKMEIKQALLFPSSFVRYKGSKKKFSYSSSLSQKEKLPRKRKATTA